MADSRRDTAYAALVDALIALRRDPATERFDEYLQYAQETGRIDSPTARALRWWQRQSVRGVGDHLDEILPSLLVQLEAADQAALRAVDASDAAWRAAAGQTIATDPPVTSNTVNDQSSDAATTDPQPEPRPSEPPPSEPQPNEPLPQHPAAQPIDRQPPEPTTFQPHEPPREGPVTSIYAELVADTQPSIPADLIDGGANFVPLPGEDKDIDSVNGTSPNEHYSEYPVETMESPSPESGAPVRRTLTAGLTVLPEGPNGH